MYGQARPWPLPDGTERRYKRTCGKYLAGLPLAVFIAQDIRPSFQTQLAWLRQGPRGVSGSSACSRDTARPCRWSVRWRRSWLSRGGWWASSGCSGWEARQGPSFGLHLIRGLTEQLHGTLVFAHDQGTCVTLRFPA
jgi:hypothetical protein